MMQRVLTFLSAVAALILGANKLDLLPLTPDTDLHTKVEALSMPGLNTVILSTDLGDRYCLVRFGLPGPPGKYTATLSKGGPLRVVPSSSARTPEAQVDEIEVVDSIPDSRGLDRKFKWPSESELVLSSPTESIGTGVDWKIFLTDGPCDSSEKALWRRVWRFVSWPLFLLSVFYSGRQAVIAWSRRESSQPLTVDVCRARIIASIKGNSAEDSQAMREILEKLFREKMPPEIALQSVEIPIEKASLLKVAATHQYRERLRAIRSGLTVELERVESLRNSRADDSAT